MNSPLNFLKESLFFGLVLLGSFPLLPVSAEVIADYLAPASPASSESGWTTAGRAKAGALVKTPEPAWRIAPEEGNALSYSIATAESLLPDAFAKGWKFSARIRLDPAVVTPIGRHVATLGVENADKKEAFILWVRTDEADGGLLVELNRKVVRLPGLAPDAFHDYAMIYDSAAASVRLVVDGTVVAEGISPTPTDRWFLRWGHQSVSARGVAEWAAVKFEAPAPSKP